METKYTKTHKKSPTIETLIFMNIKKNKSTMESLLEWQMVNFFPTHNFTYKKIAHQIPW